MARLRTIDGCYAALHEIDLDCAVSKRYIRQLVVTGQIPSRKSGRKYLVDLDVLLRYLSGEEVMPRE